ncbi:hypothetical protein ACIRSS_30580 [Amycolatopsis sp. NPDC101161]|uniref:hypothetical protein n=1 Tax=Amycolatopsis sp. NPDC101161 TaxID=3363940 RepID=UPI0037FF9B2A
MSIALGTLPDWFSGVGAVGALVAASLAAKAAFGQVEHMRNQIDHAKELEQEAVRRERRSAASQVAIWIESVDRELCVYYTNRSGLPIYSATIVSRITWLNKIISTNYATLGPTEEPRRLKRVELDLRKVVKEEVGFFRVAQPKGQPAQGRFKIKSDGALAATGYEWWSDLAADQVRVGLAFMDAAEIPWVRHPHGELTEHGMRGAAVAFLEGEWERFEFPVVEEVE